jgi:hypothetical protein
VVNPSGCRPFICKCFDPDPIVDRTGVSLVCLPRIIFFSCPNGDMSAEPFAGYLQVPEKLESNLARANQ